MSIRQTLPYTVRVGTNDLARFMSREDAEDYASDHSTVNNHVRYQIVYNPRYNINDTVRTFYNGLPYIRHDGGPDC